MTRKAKVFKFLEESGWNDQDLVRASKAAKRHLSKNDVTVWKKGGGLTIDKAIIVAQTLEWSLEWLLDDTLEWPPVPQGHRPPGKVLTGPEEMALKYAYMVSERDSDPTLLMTAVGVLAEAYKAQRSLVAKGGNPGPMVAPGEGGVTAAQEQAEKTKTAKKKGARSGP